MLPDPNIPFDFINLDTWLSTIPLPERLAFEAVDWESVMSFWEEPEPMTIRDAIQLVNEYLEEEASFRNAVQNTHAPGGVQLELEVPCYLDGSADLNSTHYPRLESQPWFPKTQHHFMTSLKLTPCARLLWDWLLLKAPAGNFIKAELCDFQAVTAEHRRGKPYSMRQIRNAVSELEKLSLVRIKSECIHMAARHAGPVTNHKRRSDSRKLTSKGGNQFPNVEVNFTNGKLTSNPKAETPTTPSSQPPTDLYRSISDHFSPPTPPGGEGEKNKEQDIKTPDQGGQDVEKDPHFVEEQASYPAQQPIDRREGNYSAAGVEFSKTTPQPPIGMRDCGGKDSSRNSLLEVTSSPQVAAPPIKRGESHKEIWEIAPGCPYPNFLNWKEDSYKEQGGHWEKNSASYAYSEFYNNRVRTTEVLWPEFTAAVNRVTENNNQCRAAGMPVVLPSWFASRRPDPTEENVRILMANVEALLPDARVLPQASTPTSSSLALPYEQATNSSIAPLPALQTENSPQFLNSSDEIGKPKSQKLTSIPDIIEAMRKRSRGSIG